MDEHSCYFEFGKLAQNKKTSLSISYEKIGK